ncbi:MAG: hypothetical protein GOVbin4296_55 [Prokaryotic dsDNA virus sp.]|nr:MAG: hypothetical protein GOVbin4296_55 [Prokaryotic dsDNA virus sp.]|tara:strand:+ start:554 stop:733 length:180 start_codon:yes stop_codon:yes gene_type:complete
MKDFKKTIEDLKNQLKQYEILYFKAQGALEVLEQMDKKEEKDDSQGDNGKSSNSSTRKV